MLSETISEKIFQIHPLIRFVGVYKNGELYCSYRKDIKPYIDQTKTIKSLEQAAKRWKERKELLSPGLGDPLYSVTMYGMVKRIAMELKDGSIILLSTELEIDHEKLLLELMDNRDLF